MVVLHFVLWMRRCRPCIQTSNANFSSKLVNLFPATRTRLGLKNSKSPIDNHLDSSLPLILDHHPNEHSSLQKSSWPPYNYAFHQPVLCACIQTTLMIFLPRSAFPLEIESIHFINPFCASKDLLRYIHLVALSFKYSTFIDIDIEICLGLGRNN